MAASLFQRRRRKRPQTTTHSYRINNDKSDSRSSDATNNSGEVLCLYPLFASPKFLTGKYAGDVGFDPLGFASSVEQLVHYREAEVKHARIAMLVSILYMRVSRIATFPAKTANVGTKSFLTTLIGSSGMATLRTFR
jgi:hypothetical protein